MPALLIDGTGLVKTTQFRSPAYVGDASNTCRIFNQMEVDELILFDIRASSKKRPIQFELVQQIVSECFMPICYGGGVKSLDDFERLFHLGLEKVSVSSLLFSNPKVVESAVKRFGAQSIVATVDVKRSRWRNRWCAFTMNGKYRIETSLDEVLSHVQALNVGEVIVNNIERDGTLEGFDCELVKAIASRVEMPVVALGGAGCLSHISEVVDRGQASAVAIGSMAVFQSKGMGVLVKFPKIEVLDKLFGDAG